MEIKQQFTAPTHWAKIYISGPLDVIEHTCRQHCFERGLCVTVTPTKFIYTGGEETGVEVGLINYPRFISTALQITQEAEMLAERLLEATFQHSVLVMSPLETKWLSLREP